MGGGSNSRRVGLFLFFMSRVFAAKRAEFAEFDTLGMQLLILGRRVIAPPASHAFKLDEFPHDTLLPIL